MLQYEELRLKLLESEKPLNELADAIGLKELESEIEKLTAQTAEDGFWNDVANSNKIMQKLAKGDNSAGLLLQQDSPINKALDKLLLDVDSLLNDIKKNGLDINIDIF